MISEKKFATAYTSFWQQSLPMADAFIRRVNLDYYRYIPPLKSSTLPQRRALVNEVAFRLFVAALEHPEVTQNNYAGIMDEVCSKSTRYIAALRGSSNAPFDEPSGYERRESVTITERLSSFFGDKTWDRNIIGSPDFPGCGIVQQCQADILAGTTLFEVKAVERDFRLVDFRQLIVYCALNYAASKYAIQNVGVVNPRVGISFTMNVEEFVRNVAGVSSVELFTEIVRFLSSERISR